MQVGAPNVLLVSRVRLIRDLSSSIPHQGLQFGGTEQSPARAASLQAQ
jgi:hypothetical protein